MPQIPGACICFSSNYQTQKVIAEIGSNGRKHKDDLGVRRAEIVAPRGRSGLVFIESVERILVVA
jgi:hypothetical protein